MVTGAPHAENTVTVSVMVCSSKSDIFMSIESKKPLIPIDSCGAGGMESKINLLGIISRDFQDLTFDRENDVP